MNYSLRTIKKLKPIVRCIRPLSSTHNLRIFPRSFIRNDRIALPPIFRLLDEIEQYSRNKELPTRSDPEFFIPKFDVREHTESYELHGELPGIDQKDIEIEFTNPSTLVIKGRTKRIYTQASPATDLNEDDTSSKADTSESTHKAPWDDKNNKKRHEHQNSTVVANKEKKSTVKFWVKERSVGEFSRSFDFPIRVDQDNVKASMKNGILSVFVPKAKQPQGRKIQIQSSQDSASHD